MLLGAAKLQAADSERRSRRPDRAGLKAFEPLYSVEDVAACLGFLRETRYCYWNDLGKGNGFRLRDTRRIVGSASVELKLAGQRILVSGVVGNGGAICCAGGELGGYDHVLCESTYGNRDREPVLISDRREQLACHVEDVLDRGGNLLILAFAVERTQVVLEDFVVLFEAKRRGSVNVFVDSPLAERVTLATMRHRPSGYDLLDHPNLCFTHEVADSKKLNSITGAVILAGSGMCQGGRIRHHLLRNLPFRQSRVLLVGYQVRGTLGAVLRDGAHHVRISGYDVAVNAEIRSLDPYSNHADRSSLLDWLKARAPYKDSIFLVHGEAESFTVLSEDFGRTVGLAPVIVPELGSAWELKTSEEPKQVGRPRADARTCIALLAWISSFADLESGLADRLRTLPSDSARERTVAALKHALERAEGDKGLSLGRVPDFLAQPICLKCQRPERAGSHQFRGDDS